MNGGGINRSCSEPELKLAKERWWSSVFSRDADFDMSMGGKLIILDKILKICKQKREKLLIFSQSLLSLDIIEQHLKYQNQVSEIYLVMIKAREKKLREVLKYETQGRECGSFKLKKVLFFRWYCW